MDDDEVIDYMLMEALATKDISERNEAQEKAAEDARIKEWKKKAGEELRSVVGK